MVNKVTIITNNTPRPILYGYELTEKEREEFDYLDFTTSDSDGFFHNFVKYKGHVYDLCEFMAINGAMFGALKYWHGYASDSYFSGVVIKHKGAEHVIMGRYYS